MRLSTLPQGIRVVARLNASPPSCGFLGQDVLNCGKFTRLGGQMSTYKEIQAQIEELKRQADFARANEIAGVKEQIVELMRSYDLSIADIQAAMGKARAKKSRAAVAAKYWDPETGQTWTGRGRAPLWLSGKDKEQFLIKS